MNGNSLESKMFLILSNYQKMATCYYLGDFTTSGVKSVFPVVRLDTIQM